MPSPLGDLQPEEFLREYWQKRPCLIRQAIPGFVPEVDGDDLAGLACEPLAEARIVTGSYPAHDWQLRHGPFAEGDFATLPEKDWALLVQDVEKHYPPLYDLLEQFAFLPSWRLDDLMISYAAPGGSVGPHVDQYDVFLLQAEGRRRWQIAECFDPALLPGVELNVLREFTPEREWVLEPGDLLYLPPGVAHHGVALTAGMTWSIGLRAPDAADLLMALGEWLAADSLTRYADPDLEAVRRAGEIDAPALARLRGVMLTPLQDDASFREFAGRFLTRFRLAHEPAPPGEAVTASEVASLLASGARLMRNPWTRLAWLQADGHARLYAAGEVCECSIPLAELLCSRHEPGQLARLTDERDLEALSALVNSGHLVWSE